MGIFNKLKSIFYDEVTVEDDDSDKDIEEVRSIKKEVVREELPKVEEVKFKKVEPDPVINIPVKEEKVKEEVVDDKNLFRSERTFNFVDFTDDDVVEEVKPEQQIVPRRNVVDDIPRRNIGVDTTRLTRSTEPAKDDTPRTFKPSPVISPIWGVLDKDYKKDEIKEKPNSTKQLTASVTDYDNVRRKAYGTLEDELEDTLNSLTKDDVKREYNKSKGKEEVRVLDNKHAKIEELIGQIDEVSNELDKSMTLEEADNSVKISSFDDNDSSDKTISDNTLEHDLFNLIDSMYDKED